MKHNEIFFLLLKIANKKFKNFFVYYLFSIQVDIKDSADDYYTICDNLGHS